MLGYRGSAVGLYSRQPQQLQSRGAHAACRASDQCGLPGLHFRYAMDHLPRSDIVQDHGSRSAIGNSGGDRKEMFGLAQQNFGEGAVNGERRHTLSNRERCDIGADSFNDARDFVARHERYLGRVAIIPGQDQEVG